MKNIVNIFLATLCVAVFSACTEDDNRAGGEGIEQMATLYSYSNGTKAKANLSRSIDIEVSDLNEHIVEKEVAVGVNFPVPTDEEISLEFSADEAQEYIKKNDLDAQVLPAGLVKLPENMSIKKGYDVSEPATLQFTINEQIKENVPYIVVLKLKSLKNRDNECFHILNQYNTIVYTVQRVIGSVEITKAVHLDREHYLMPKTPLPWDFYNDGLTIETLVNVQKFRTLEDPGEAQISSLFGIERTCLFRFGDAGVPGNYLQCMGQKMDFPFVTNHWYHIAAVFMPDRTLKVYVDGKEKLSVSDKNPVISGVEWFIGRSYSNGRGIDAQFSEFRIWKKALTPDQITDGMYGADPKSPELIAYWKMDKADGNMVKDETGNGYDLEMKIQGDKVTENNVTVDKLKEPIEIED